MVKKQPQLTTLKVRTRRSYDTVASTYGARISGELEHKPFDRARLDAFAARVRDHGVCYDLGCGPGHVACYLAR